MRLLVREEEFLPRFSAMTGFTAVRHFLVELPFVDILMTARAVYRSVPKKLPRAFCIDFVTDVACKAGNGGMSTE